MKTTLARPRVAAAVFAAALLPAIPALAAPKKAEPVPATAPAPAPEKKNLFTRAKELVGLKKKETPPPAAEQAPPAKTAKAKPAPKPETAAKSKPAAPVPAKQPAVAAAKPAPPAAAEEKRERKGWLKGLFGRKDEAPAAAPALANAKTAKPAPVKEVKPGKEAEKLAAAEPAPQKRGLFGFFKKLSGPAPEASPAGDLAEDLKVERPADWEEHRIVKEDGIALYSFGPSQATGPDERLKRGAVVKVKSVKRGWALVEVNGGGAGYMDASMLREAAQTDFKEPPPPAVAAINPDFWAPLAPPPDLPDQPMSAEDAGALLLLPPLELEPKPNP